MLTPLQIVNKIGNAKRKYNDKIAGGRSFKVEGWGVSAYESAKALAIHEGYNAKVVVTPELCGGKYGGEHRLHITTK